MAKMAVDAEIPHGRPKAMQAYLRGAPDRDEEETFRMKERLAHDRKETPHVEEGFAHDE
jgi:hypothetical protein